MDNLLQLCDLMEKKLEEYNSLLNLSLLEKEAVVSNDVQKMSAIVEKQQEALVVIKGLESKQNNLLESFEAGYEAPDRKFSLKRIIETAQTDTGDKLIKLTNELDDISKKLHSICALNRTLIDTQLSYTSFCINVLTGQGSEPRTYSGSGRVNQGLKLNNRLMDQVI